MPANLWEICNVVQRSFQGSCRPLDRSHNLTYLSAIQSLTGKTPGQKYKEFNNLIKRVLDKIHTKNGATDPKDFREVPYGLVPLVRTIVADKLQNAETLKELVQLEDPYVNRIILKSKWFFSGDNSYVNITYFMCYVMPSVSMKMRSAIARKLSYTLEHFESEAQSFFEGFTEAYGYKLSVPILLACSEDFIYKKILEHKIILPPGLLSRLYEKKPNAAIKYLQLANTNNKENENDRKLIEVRIYVYDGFLPKLIRKHPQVFAELYELTPDRYFKLSNAKATLFLDNLLDTLVEKPKVYLKLLPISMVQKRLDKEKFKRMFERLFPKDKSFFSLSEMVGYLIGFEKADTWRLLKYTYKAVYRSDFPTHKFLETTKDLRFVKMIPDEERAPLANELMEKHADNADLFKFVMSYSESETLFVALKDTIKQMHNQADREIAFNSIIISCYLYNNKTILLEFLEYFYEHHKNETACVTVSVFERISLLKWEDLDGRHWDVLMKIIRYRHARNELYSANYSPIEWALKKILRHHLSENVNNEEAIDEILRLILILKVEYCLPDWNILKGDPKFEKICLDKLLRKTAVAYPEKHSVWDNVQKQACIALEVVKSFLEYNERNCSLTKKQKRDTSACLKNFEEKFKIECYPWLTTLIDRHLSNNDVYSYRKRKLKEIIENEFSHFYKTRPYLMQFVLKDFESGRALALLRKDPQKIMDYWEDYVDQAAIKLSCGSKAARRFVEATKWHQDLPIKFVERSYSHVKEQGFVIVLGILLDGDALAKLITNTFDMKEPVKIEPNEAQARKKFALVKELLVAMKYSVPPIALPQLLKFQNPDFVKFTEPTLVSLTNNISSERMANFARQWVDCSSLSVKKQGIRLYRRVAVMDEILKFLKELYLTEKSLGVRFYVTKVILDVFAEVPCTRTWLLVKDSLTNLTADNLVNLSSLLTNLQLIHKDYLSDYVSEFLDVLDDLAGKGLKPKAKANIISLLIENLDPVRTSFLSQTVVMKILNRYFFDVNSSDVSCVTQRFAVVSYLMPANDDFEDRLQTIIDKFKVITRQYGKPCSRNPRYYPAKDAVQTFFKCLTTELERKHPSDKKLHIVDSFIKAFNASLEPYQALASNMRLNFYIEYLSSSSPRDFGSRCVGRAYKYLESLSELFIHDIGETICKIIAERNKPLNYLLELIDGLVDKNDRVGCLIAVMLLDELNISNCDEKYDNLIQKLLNVPDMSVQVYLDKHVCRIAEAELE